MASYLIYGWKILLCEKEHYIEMSDKLIDSPHMIYDVDVVYIGEIISTINDLHSDNNIIIDKIITAREKAELIICKYPELQHLAGYAPTIFHVMIDN